jgi:radical SAM protein with 4Fe4S-binding SPASM domain
MNYHGIEANIRDSGLPPKTVVPLIMMCKEKNAIYGRYAELFNRKVLCFFPWKEVTIDPLGNVYPCCFSNTFQHLSEDLRHGFWGEEDFAMGNIRESSLEEIWTNEKYSQFRAKCKRHTSFPFCNWCSYRTVGDVILTGLLKDRSLLKKIVLSKLKSQKVGIEVVYN